MKLNPINLLKISSMKDKFIQRHTKFPLFLSAVKRAGLEEGTLISFKVTEPDGHVIRSNILLEKEDIELLRQLGDLANMD